MKYTIQYINVYEVEAFDDIDFKAKLACCNPDVIKGPLQHVTRVINQTTKREFRIETAEPIKRSYDFPYIQRA